MIGFPFLAGFYSKDHILEGIYNGGESALPLGAFLAGVGVTAAYSAKLTRLAVSSPGGRLPVDLAAGATRPATKLPLLRLGRGAVLGGAVLVSGVSSDVPVLSPRDKLFPLLLIRGGAVMGVGLRRLKSGYLRRLWDLTPTVQALAGRSPGLRSLAVLDEGAAEVLGGRGWLVVLLGWQMTLYPALALGPLFLLPLLV